MAIRSVMLFGLSVVALVAANPPCYAQDITNLGGALSTDLPGRHAIQVNAPNVTDDSRRDIRLGGFAKFHVSFTKDDGLGPQFVNSTCGGCHIDNGRGPAKFSTSNIAGSAMVVKLSLPGLNPDGSPKDVPGVGEQLQDHSVKGHSNVTIKLGWSFLTDEFFDGTPFTLRKPALDYRIKGISTRKFYSSLRMTPPVIGPGLLEAVSDATILEYSDPDDLNNDGISGHPNYILDKKTNAYAIGRFGFKASHSTVEQQSAAALVNDIGITNSTFFDPLKPVEYSDVDMNFLVLYQKLAGVPRAINQDDPSVISGKALFQSIGCNACHRMTMKTGVTSDPELSNQEFHPFTDLLLHDMGKGLADKRAEFSARGSEWRTTPLWGLGFSKRLAGRKAVFLHDGRARTIEEAILWHGGEAADAQRRYKTLSVDLRKNLLDFLDSL